MTTRPHDPFHPARTVLGVVTPQSPDTPLQGAVSVSRVPSGDVPENAVDVADWIKAVEGEERTARAVAALEVEHSRTSPRSTVMKACQQVLDLA
jgi:hypothetical protein